MPLSTSNAIDAATQLEKSAGVEWARLRRFVRYSRGVQKLPWLPDNVESEYKDIAKKSASNWLDLVIRAVTQGLYVDGYGDRRTSTTDDEEPEPTVWDLGWQANGMDARQHSLHRAIGTLGYSWLFVFMAEGDEPGVWMRPEAATKVAARYEDAADEWPEQVLRVVAKDHWELYDAEARYTIVGKDTTRRVTVTEHELQVCPAVQMRAAIDLLGSPMGDVEPVIPIQDRIVDATFTLQMVAKYGAFPQRWIAGMDTSKPLTDAAGDPVLDAAGNPIFPTIKAYVDHILTAVDPDTKFGQFAAADLTQYVEALEAHIRHLAAITQTPPHYLLGSLVNLSAEALAAAEAGLQRKIRERRMVLGEGYEQALRLGSLILGDQEAANDTSSRVHWDDVESRSLAQTADALGKLHTLGVPLPLLMRMIPGFTQQDVDEATKIIEDGGGIDALARELLERDASPTTAE